MSGGLDSAATERRRCLLEDWFTQVRIVLTRIRSPSRISAAKVNLHVHFLNSAPGFLNEPFNRRGDIRTICEAQPLVRRGANSKQERSNVMRSRIRRSPPPHTSKIRNGVLLGSIVPLGLAGVGVAAAQTSGASTDTVPTTGPTSITSGTGSAAAAARQIPQPSTPIDVWQSWSENVQKSWESVPWAELFEESGCTVSSVSYGSVPASLGLKGAPLGIDTTTVGLQFFCQNGQEPAFLAGISSAKTDASLRSHGVPQGRAFTKS